MSSAAEEKLILVPRTLAHTHLRWHVGAYLETQKDYCDFVLALLHGTPDFNGDSESTAEKDTLWNTEVTIRLQPDSRLGIAQQSHH